jgi:hypothetical protein
MPGILDGAAYVNDIFDKLANRYELHDANFTRRHVWIDSEIFMTEDLEDEIDNLMQYLEKRLSNGQADQEDR